MKSAWRVSHDPLKLSHAVGEISSFEEEARSHGEDLMQWERLASAKKEVLDLGWYRDRYLVLHVAAENWSSPLQRIESRDLASAVTALRRLAE